MIFNKIVISGSSGFVGSKLLSQLNHLNGCFSKGFDNYSRYYDVKLKEDRVAALLENTRDKVLRWDLREGVPDLGSPPDIFIHLAAQPGVRESLRDPMAYEENNIRAFVHVLEYCRRNNVKHLIYASSSSVYGLSTRLPFSEDDPCDRPASFYGATKKSNELMAHSYASCFGLPCTGLRFFTVYGP